jgi:hypothetical protein
MAVQAVSGRRCEQLFCEKNSKLFPIFVFLPCYYARNYVESYKVGLQDGIELATRRLVENLLRDR